MPEDCVDICRTFRIVVILLEYYGHVFETGEAWPRRTEIELTSIVLSSIFVIYGTKVDWHDMNMICDPLMEQGLEACEAA